MAGLEVSDLRVVYDGVPAVDDVSLRLEPGHVLAVLGPSGCGKSTLLRAVAGLEPPVAGSIRFDGEDLAGVPTHRRGFALMFQDGQLFAHLTVAGNVGYALRLRRVPAPARAARVAELLELVGLRGYGERLPGTLSGGERQRVALARALAVQPRLLLLDEPLSSLDASLRGRLADDLRRILVEAGTTAVLVTHDHDEAFAVADRMAVMRSGALVQEGPVAEVWERPADAATALFLGYARVLEGAAATAVQRAAGRDGPPTAMATAVAVRRSAFVVDPAGPLAAEVVAARSAPGRTRLVVDAEGVGTVDAVADGSSPGPGQQVRLRVDVTRIARLSAG